MFDCVLCSLPFDTAQGYMDHVVQHHVVNPLHMMDERLSVINQQIKVLDDRILDHHDVLIQMNANSELTDQKQDERHLALEKEQESVQHLILNHMEHTKKREDALQAEIFQLKKQIKEWEVTNQRMLELCELFKVQVQTPK